MDEEEALELNEEEQVNNELEEQNSVAEEEAEFPENEESFIINDQDLAPPQLATSPLTELPIAEQQQIQERLAVIKAHLDKALIILESRILSDPHDLDAWENLLHECISCDPPYVRDVFERATAAFPTSSYVWMLYAGYEYKSRNYKCLEAIFAKCLKSLLDVEMWKFYLSYVKQMNLDVGMKNTLTASSKEQRSVVCKAFEFALSFIGLHLNSTPIWMDYLDFVRSFQTNSLWEEQQKMDLTRKIYQRVVQLPINNLEQLWKEYDAFENGLNKLTAKKIVGDCSGAYMKARGAIKELKGFYDCIDREKDVFCESNSNRQIQELQRWIEWEKGNPLNLSKELLEERITFAFKTSQLYAKNIEEFWVDFYYFLQNEASNKEEEAFSLLEKAVQCFPQSIMFTSLLAISMESKGLEEQSQQVYEQLLVSLNAAEKKDEKEITKAYMAYFKHTRRFQDIKAARQVFAKARKNTSCQHEMYVLAAMTEFHCCKDAITAGKIFELAFKKFSTNTAFICSYLKFLIATSDESNIRAVFERALQTVQGQDVREMWQIFTEYEESFGSGDSEMLMKLLKRKKEALGLRNIDLFSSKPQSPLSVSKPIPKSHTSNPSSNNSIPSRFNSVITSFLNKLPKSEEFDGPKFDVDFIMAVIQRIPEDAIKRKSERLPPIRKKKRNDE